jgi:hypothetical protein
MELWDAYDEEIGSESDRPDFYEADQLFSIIMLGQYTQIRLCV